MKKNNKKTAFFFCIITNLLMTHDSVKSQDSSERQQISSKENNNLKENHDEKKEVKLTAEQLKLFDIQTIVLSKNNFRHRLTFPGQIALNENKITHVVASVPGTVKEIFKSLGEGVKSGEALATLQSRDMAEAKSSYISTYKNLTLKRDLFERDEKLWKQKVKPEIQFIQTRNIYENAKIDLEQAKQKLLALNMTEEQIKNLSQQTEPLNIYTIYSPIEGKIIERHITLGEVISNDKQIFVLANLDTVWINLAIPSEDLSKIKKDQEVSIFTHQGKNIFSGKIMYVGPVINEESRTGRAIIQLENREHELHPGDFIKAQVIVSQNSALLSLPNSAVQRIEGKSVVFIKSKDNIFEAKTISIKGSDKGEFIEIIEGLKEGDEIVIKNTFLLKAELGKSEAEHSH